MTKFEVELFRKDFRRPVNMRRLEELFSILFSFDKVYRYHDIDIMRDSMAGVLYRNALEEITTSTSALNSYMKKEEGMSVHDIIKKEFEVTPLLFLPVLENTTFEPSHVFKSENTPLFYKESDIDHDKYENHIVMAYHNAEYKYACCKYMNRLSLILIDLLDHKKCNFNFDIINFIKLHDANVHSHEMLMLNALIDDPEINKRCKMMVTSEHMVYCEYVGYLNTSGVKHKTDHFVYRKNKGYSDQLYLDPVICFDEQVKVIHDELFTEELSKLTF